MAQFYLLPTRLSTSGMNHTYLKADTHYVYIRPVHTPIRAVFTARIYGCIF